MILIKSYSYTYIIFDIIKIKIDFSKETLELILRTQLETLFSATVILIISKDIVQLIVFLNL